MSSALQMAYEESCLSLHERRIGGELDAIRRAGRVAVVIHSPRYCPVTDAQMPGHDEWLAADFATEAEADAYIAAEEADPRNYCSDHTLKKVLP